MFNIQNYNVDGANWQAQAVACYLKGNLQQVLDRGWNRENRTSDVTVEIGRYENCREQGYVVRMCCGICEINACYCFFEHRNSDQLCCIKFNVCSINTPSIDDIWKDRTSKYDVDFSVGYGEISKMGDYIITDMLRQLDEYLGKTSE